MPPKKKVGKEKSPPTGSAIDGVDTSHMTRAQLETFALKLKEENEREREERNLFQSERDQIRSFWEITKNELEETKADLRNKDKKIEEAAESHRKELKLLKEKVKHLQYEHQINLTECKAKLAQDDYTEQERGLVQDNQELQSRIRGNEVSIQDQINDLKLQFNEEIHQARQFVKYTNEKGFNNLNKKLK